MDVTAERVAKVPAENLRLPRDLFGRLWGVAEQRAGTDDDYVLGVVCTCRWLAGYRATWGALSGLPRSPFLGREVQAMPETIEEEYLAAAVAAERCRGLVDDGGAGGRARGVAATLAWTWQGQRTRPPLEIPGYQPLVHPHAASDR